MQLRGASQMKTIVREYSARVFRQPSGDTHSPMEALAIYTILWHEKRPFEK
jgi:hypothetical protein